MEQMNDGILALLQDIKQMIFGCGLLLLGIFLTILAVFVSPIFLLAGIPMMLSGCLYVWNGYTTHTVVKNDPTNEEHNP